MIMVRLRPEGPRRPGPGAQVPDIAHGLRGDAKARRETRRQRAARLSMSLCAKDFDRLP